MLFDWRGVLALDPELSWWIRRALESLGRPTELPTIEAHVHDLEAAEGLPEVVDAMRYVDCSLEQNRSSMMFMFERAGFDAELAEALYQLDFDPASHPLYPDVPEVLATIRDLGIRTAVVSDIHFDLRTDLAHHGVGHLFDAYVLSFEHGFQKPDPRMFALALDALEVGPGDALMVGDRASHDGGAAAVGIATLLLPPMHELGPRRLDFIPTLVRG